MALDADAIVKRVQQEVARRLLAAAITLQSAHREDVSRGNPAPHDHPAPPGEFPKLRTGSGRANVAVAPASIAAVTASVSVAVGYRPAGVHLYFLGLKGWKAIQDTYQRERTKIQAILEGAP